MAPRAQRFNRKYWNLFSIQFKAGDDGNSERGYEVASGGATDASITLMGAWRWGHSHLFQSRLASHHVLGLLLLCFFVVESLEFLKVGMTFLLFHAMVWFVGLFQCAFSIAPIFVLRHGESFVTGLYNIQL